MCDMCDGMSRRELRERSKLRIARYGFTMTCVEPSRNSAPFGYTLGLTEMQQPELLVSGLDAETTCRVLTVFAQKVLAGEEFSVPGLMPLSEDRSVCALAVDSPGPVLVNAYELYGRRVRGIQLVWADGDGRFPWAPNANPEVRQPLFGTPPHA